MSNKDEQLDILNLILESVEKEHKDEETEDVVDKDEGIGGGESGEGGQAEEEDLEEGKLGDLAKRAASAVAGGTKDLVKGLAKGAVEGVLGPKDVRLMKTATEAFTEVLQNNGISTTDKHISNVLSKLLAKAILKQREKENPEEVVGELVDASEVEKD